ncbi:class I SAM-dependent methyltransferase [Aeromicrobium sp. CF3.5]|uniref:class I SAM-dependent methyltransferase n=1 Tax=Aeromicrobium sp. CF3.5 TaxID=3373078 RepID=UPI003EE48C7C
MYESDVAEIWDAVYTGRGRDYPAEARWVEGAVRDLRPAATSLLDVGCGTGEHLRHLQTLFDEVEGVELSADMIASGLARSPELTMHQSDMRDFDLGRTFSAVVTLFSSIAHMATGEDLDGAVSRLAAHTEPGGVVIVEGWWFPENFIDGYVTGDVVEDDGRVLARVSHSSRVEDSSRIQSHFVVSEPAGGLRHFTEDFRLTLFTQGRYEEAFAQAGLSCTYRTDGPSKPGAFIGTREPAPSEPPQ